MHFGFRIFAHGDPALPGFGSQTRAAVLQLLLWTCALGFAAAARAESQDFGNYTVHYIAVNTTFLSPDIAEEYNIVRSDRRAFLNIAVIRNNADGSPTPVEATVMGSKSNLLQQSDTIAFDEIREGDAVYYIGQFDFSNAENIRFSVSVQPERKGPAHEIEWTTQLYAD
jgi:hypothetical protein